jgi:hypothetical protein
MVLPTTEDSVKCQIFGLYEGNGYCGLTGFVRGLAIVVVIEDFGRK